MTTSRRKPATKRTSAPAPAPSSLDGLGQLLEKLKIPDIDIDTLVDWQRKDLEALVEVHRQAYEGIKALVERRNEILQETLAQWRGALQDTTGMEEFARQSEAAKRGLQQAIDHFGEISDMEAQLRNDSWKIVQGRLQENMANLQKLLQPK